MKVRITPILFFSVLIAPALIGYCCLQYQRSMVKRELKWKMIAGIDKEELALLKLSKDESANELRWEHSKEFEYKEQMYDVIKKEIRGDSIFYWCWWDHEETKLNRQLADLVGKALSADPQKKEAQDRLQSYFKSLYCFEVFNWCPAVPNQTPHHHSIYLVKFSSLLFPTFSPPPELS